MTLDDAVHAVSQEAPKIYDALLTWAQKEVNAAEADHFGGMIDDAHERATGG